MPYTLNISDIYYEEVDNVTYVTFATCGDDQNREYLTLQNPNLFDEQDISLGMNYAHVEFCDQNNSQYGGIQKILLEDNILTISFDKASVIVKQTGFCEIKLRFSGTPANFSRAVHELKKISTRDGIINNL